MVGPQHSTELRKGLTRGLGHQEAAQANVEEEAPEAASQDQGATSKARQVGSHLRPKRDVGRIGTSR
jgi:hypothetical protein